MKCRVYLREITLTDLYLQYRLSSARHLNRGYSYLAYIPYTDFRASQRLVPGVELTDFAHVVTLPRGLVLSWEYNRARRKYLGRLRGSARENRWENEPERERERRRGLERGRGRVRKRWERSSRVEGKGKEGSTHRKREAKQPRGRSANETPGRWWRRRCLTSESHQKSSPGTSSSAVSRLDEEVVLSASPIVWSSFFFGFFPRTVKHKFSQDCILDTRKDWGGRRLLLSAMGTGKSWCLRKRSGPRIYISPSKRPVSRLGYLVNVQSLYFPMEIIFAPYGALRSPSWEMFGSMGTNLRKPGSPLDSRRSSANSMFSDSFRHVWRLRRGFNMIDRLVRAAADVAVPQVVDRRDADAALASSRVKAEIIRQCLSSTGITPRLDHSRTRLECSFPLNSS